MQDDDFKLQNYQDDLDTEFDDTDPLMEAQGGDLTEELEVPPEEVKKELAALELDDDEENRDASEIVEDSKHDAGY